MEPFNKFYSTRSSSLKKYENMLSISNLKLINKPKIYHPLNPKHPFKLDMLNLKEISKRKNALLINSKPLKELILKYNLDEKKNSNENHDPNKYYFNKFKDEEKNYKLTINAILKNNIDNLPLYLSGRKTDKKKKKINFKFNFSRNDNNSLNSKKRFLTSFSEIRTKNSKNSDITKDKIIDQYNTKTKASWNLKINKYNLKTLGIRMKLSKTNKKYKLLKNYGNIDSKTIVVKKHLSFSVTNLKSVKLGRISIFGVFEEIGAHGRAICSVLMNYLIDYFKSSKKMNVCIERDNFYSILHWSFVNSQKFLIKNQKKLNIDLSNSGCSACFLLLPKNINNKIYCANSGICKCLLYTNRGPDIFSFSLTIDRPSERERIYMFLKNKKISKLLDLLNEKNINDKNEKNITKDKNNKNNNKKDNNKVNKEDNKEDKEEDQEDKEEDNKEDKQEDDKDIREETKQNEKNPDFEINEEELKRDFDISILYFKYLGFTRCFGNISGENYGLIPNPEVNECDIKVNKVRFAVLGNNTFWKILKEPEIRFIVSKYISNKDNLGASKELGDLIRHKAGTNSKILEKSGYEIIYFDNFL